jgi:hypothetical protein
MEYSRDYLIEARDYIESAKSSFNEEKHRDEIWFIEKAIQKLNKALEVAQKEYREC